MVQEFISIGPDKLTFYNHYPKKSQAGKCTQKSKDNLKKKYQSPCLSQASAKSIEKILTHWILAINLTQQKQTNPYQKKRNYLVMITLTLPSNQIESDKEIKRKYLNNFLIQLQKEYVGIHYLWVAEKQKNGNIHFHIIVDRWVNQFEISRKWNNILNNGIYIKSFYEKFKHVSPPSTKITGQKNMGNPAKYITKYVKKSTDSLKIEGKKWGCSKELQNIKTIQILCKDWYKMYLAHYKDEMKLKIWSNEHCEIIYFSGNFLNDFVFHDIFYDNEVHITSCLQKLYPELKPSVTPLIAANIKESAHPKQLSLSL